MFTEQAATLDELIPLFARVGLDGNRITEVFRKYTANCIANYVHRGSLKFEHIAEAGRRDATLDVSRYPAKPATNHDLDLDPDGDDGGNGFAFRVRNGWALFNGPMLGGFKWVQANADWVNVAGGAAWASYVDCTVVADKDGTALAPERTVRVYLPRTATSDPNVRQGDVIAIMQDAGGYAVCLSDVLDGRIGDVRHLVTATAGEITAFQASGGYRGWHTMDGNHGSTDADGDSSMLWGYTGAGDFATLGGSVTAAITATISGNGGTTSVSVVNANVTISIDNHASGQSCTVNESSHSHGITLTSFTVDGVAEDPGEEETLYAFTGSSASTGLQSTGLTVTTPTLTHSWSVTAHNHTASVANDSIAGALSVAATSLRPAGRIVLRIQRLT